MCRGGAGREIATTHLDKAMSGCAQDDESSLTVGLRALERNGGAVAPFINLSIHSTNTLGTSAISPSQVPERL